MLGIYLHIPFCSKKCPYCNFYSINYNEKIVEEFVAAVLKEIESVNNKKETVDSIYFGGGTPSLIKDCQINKILNKIYSSFKVSENLETTIEINPNTVTKQKLLNYKEMGINRLSFGVQSFNNNELKLIGRNHTSENSINAINLALNLGFENISIDLMLGIPQQTLESLNNNFKIVKNLKITHLSLYQLKIEPNTLFYKKTPTLPSKETVASFYEVSCKKLEEMGFKQYEISNFSKPNKESRHNLKYWTLKNYLGIGPKAHSFYKGERFFHNQDILSYIKNPTKQTKEKTDPAFEWFILSLRLNKGIAIKELKLKNFYNENFKFKLTKLEKEKLIFLTDEKFSLTLKGMLLQNSVISYLLF